MAVAVGGWMVIDYSSRARDVSESRAAEPVVGTEAPVETEETPTPTPTRAREPARKEKNKKPKRERVELITEGVSVQVLNGTTDPEAGDAMSERLSRLGFEVVAVESTSTPYTDTTVFWSFPDAADAARALARRFGWEAGKKPGNLAPTVSLHVVVGRDEAGDTPSPTSR